MRKKISKLTSNVKATGQAWMDLENIASVELTSRTRPFQLNLPWSGKVSKAGVLGSAASTLSE